MAKIDLDIQIGPDGKVTFQVKGVPGSKCLDITKELEAELGEILSREYTSEYYMQETETREKEKIETGQK